MNEESPKRGVMTVCKELFDSMWNFISFKWLDDVPPEGVSNSMAFRLGAMAGVLPALSILAIGSIQSSSSILAFVPGNSLGIVLSSGLTGGAVSFFLAGNRLKEIFTYGIAGPSLVLALYGSSISSMKSTEAIKNVSSIIEQNEAALQEVEEEKSESLEAAQKVVSALAGRARENSRPSEASPTETEDSTFDEEVVLPE